jgi:hypothetical protein
MNRKILWRIGLFTVMGLTALQLGSCANIPILGPALQTLGNLLPGA